MKSLERLEIVLGNENIKKLNSASVAVIGLGGVGGICVNTLARCGVGTLIIQDFDIVQESNINRQIVANYETIGKYKVDVAYEEIKRINPDCNVIKIIEKFDENSILFNNKFDYLIDAIDDINGKFLLIKTCLDKNIELISSMGAARKLDPTKITVMDIKKTTHDPLAKILRKKLRDAQIYDKIMVASSTEMPMDTHGLGSYMPVTSNMGLILADYIIKKIIEV